jgi:hypothetical protein
MEHQWLGDEELDDAAAMQHEQQQEAAEQETIHEIDDAVDDFVTMVNLRVLFNPMPVREMTCYNLVTGERADCVPAAHWQQVGQQLLHAGTHMYAGVHADTLTGLHARMHAGIQANMQAAKSTHLHAGNSCRAQHMCTGAAPQL